MLKANATYSAAICGLVRLYNVFPHYLTKTTRFSKKKIIEHEMCDLIFCTNFVCNISQSKMN